VNDAIFLPLGNTLVEILTFWLGERGLKVIISLGLFKGRRRYLGQRHCGKDREV